MSNKLNLPIKDRAELDILRSSYSRVCMSLDPFLAAGKEGLHLGKIRKFRLSSWVEKRGC